MRLPTPRPAVCLGVLAASVVTGLAAGPLAPVQAEPAGAPQRFHPAAPREAHPGAPLPVVVKRPNVALLGGVTDDYAMVDTGRFGQYDEVPGVEHVIVDLDDGSVVRRFVDVDWAFHPATIADDAYIALTFSPTTSSFSITRTDIATGALTGTIAVASRTTSLGPDHVLTNGDTVRGFDGSVVPLTGDTTGIGTDLLSTIAYDDGAALVSGLNGTGRVIDLATGTVTRLETADGATPTRVVASLAGDQPVVWGLGPGKRLTRWADPLTGTGPVTTDVAAMPTDVTRAVLDGDRIAFPVPGATGGLEVRELDPATGILGLSVADHLVQAVPFDESSSFGLVDTPLLARPSGGLVVSRDDVPSGSLALVEAGALTSIGPVPDEVMGARRLWRDGDTVVAEMASSYDEWRVDDDAEHDARLMTWQPGDTTWAPAPGRATPTPPTPAPHDGAPCAPDQVGTAVTLGRWQSVACGRDGVREATYVVDLDGRIPTWDAGNRTVTLGATWILLEETVLGDPTPVHVDGTVYTDVSIASYAADHPMFPIARLDALAGQVVASDPVGQAPPVYIDPTGRVREIDVDLVAQAPALTPTTPALRDVASVAAVTLDYRAPAASDDVDAPADLVYAVQTARARAGAGLSGWRTRPGSADGTTVVRARPGEEWCFRAVVADSGGNLSDFSAPDCRVVPVDDRRFTATGPGVMRRTGSDFLGETVTMLTSSRDRVTVPVDAGRPRLWLTRGRGLGTVVATQRGRVLGRWSTGGRPGRLVVEVRPRGTAPVKLRIDGRKPVLLDAIGGARARS